MHQPATRHICRMKLQSFRPVYGTSESGELSGVNYETVNGIRKQAREALERMGSLAVLQRNPRSFTFWDRFQLAIRRQPDRRVIPHLRRALAGGGLDSIVRGIITQILQEPGEPAGK